MPKPETNRVRPPKAAKPEKVAKAEKVNYLVTIDGTEHSVESGGDLKDLLLATLADGAEHSVTIVEVARPEDEEEAEDTDVPDAPVDPAA